MEPAAYLPVAREQEKQVRGDRVSPGPRDRVGSRAAEQARRPAGSRPCAVLAHPCCSAETSERGEVPGSRGGLANQVTRCTKAVPAPALRLRCDITRQDCPSLPAEGESARQSVGARGACLMHGGLAFAQAPRGVCGRGRRGVSAQSSGARRTGRGCGAALQPPIELQPIDKIRSDKKESSECTARPRA